MRRCCPATRPWTKSGWRPGCAPAEFFSGSNPAALRRLVQQLRARPFDLVVDLQGLLKSAVWVALARSPRKVGYDRTRELSYLALTERVTPFDPEAHAVRRYLNLAHYLGAPPAPPRFRLGLDAAADISALIPAETGAAPGGAPSRGPLGLQTLAPGVLGEPGGVAPGPGLSGGRHRQPPPTGSWPQAIVRPDARRRSSIWPAAPPWRSWPPSCEKPGWPSPPTPGPCTWPRPWEPR